MIWLIVAAVWLLPGLYFGPGAARAYYADEMRTHLEHDKRECWRSCCYWCSPPKRAHATGIGIRAALLWPGIFAFRSVKWVFKRLGGMTFDGIEERVKSDIEVAKQLKKMQHTEKFRKELELLAFDQRTISTVDEAWRHNNNVEKLLRKMTSGDSPLELIDVELLRGRYKINAESINELEVSK